ncbi:hypothetical protein M422DRAFT_23580, partial [Sphaerobolus stellatus SS14]
MLLSDEIALSEYIIRPFELLELHHTNSYVYLPRTTLPIPRPLSPPFHTLHSTFHAARAYPGFHHKRRPPSPLPSHQYPQDDDSDDDESLVSGSPYARPYFEAWVSVPRVPINPDELQRKRKLKPARDLAMSQDGVNEYGGQEKWRRAWLVIRDGVLSVYKDRKEQKPEEEHEIALCAALHGDDKLEEWISGSARAMEKRSASSTTNPSYTICARFRETPRPPTAPSTSTDPYAYSYSYSHTHTHAPNPPRPTSRKTKEKPQNNWLIFKMDDTHSHESILRILHRLAYSSRAAAVDSLSNSLSSAAFNPSRPSTASSSLSIHQRTLRTDYLPNPIPHPLSLRFSAPSPVDVSPTSGSFTFDAEPTSSGARFGAGGLGGALGGGKWGVGLGNGMGVRFPEWREEVIRRAILAGLDWGESDAAAGAGAAAYNPFVRAHPLQHVLYPGTSTTSVTTTTGTSSTPPPPSHSPTRAASIRTMSTYNPNIPISSDTSDSSDDDDGSSNGYSEVEWDGWAYDLDRPKGLVLRGEGEGSQGSFSGGETEESGMWAGGGERGREGTWGGGAGKMRERARSVEVESPTAVNRGVGIVSVVVGSGRQGASGSGSGSGVPSGSGSGFASSGSTLLGQMITTTTTTTTVITSPGPGPSTRHRASTISASTSASTSHPRLALNPDSQRAQAQPQAQAQSQGSSQSQAAPQLQQDTDTPVGRDVDGLPLLKEGQGGRRGLMRGLTLNMMKGLENALDFVEGK